jgi:hypothetical protein
MRRLAAATAGERDSPALWIAWVRLLAVPFAVLDVLLELENFPDGHLPWAGVLTGIFAGGAALLFVYRGRPGAAGAGLAFDLAVVSVYVVFLAFELGTPVRQLLLLPVVEAALRYGIRGGALVPVACVPALFLFEWRQAALRDYYPFDPGHVVFPFGLLVLLGLVVGALARPRA